MTALRTAILPHPLEEAIKASTEEHLDRLEAAGFLPVYDFVAGETETLYRGEWRLVTEVQSGAEGKVYVRLEKHAGSKIDPATGEISSIEIEPILLTTPATYRRAHRRSRLLEGVAG